MGQRAADSGQICGWSLYWLLVASSFCVYRVTFTLHTY